jgi:hypothetical protein
MKDLNVYYKMGQPRGIAPTDMYQAFFSRDIRSDDRGSYN